MSNQNIVPTIRHEVLFFAICLLVGLFVLPAAIYAVGRALFNEFGGGGFNDFYGSVQDAIWSFTPATWFLVLSPYLVLTTLRVTFSLYRNLRVA